MTVLREYDLTGKPIGKLKLPKIFETALRPDVIKKVVVFQQSHRYQPQGRDPMAGKRTTAESMGTGLGIARMARVKGSRYPRAQQAAFIPSAVGGHRTHPPKTEKTIYKHINKKEKRLAIRSAIAATVHKNLVSSRGHFIEQVPALPLVVSDALEDISMAKEAKDICSRLGLLPDMQRVQRSLKIRAGRGTMRGRKRRHRVGPLFVINQDGGVKRALNNFLGVDVVMLKDLNVEVLAPGASPGRLTVWTVSVFKKLDERFE